MAGLRMSAMNVGPLSCATNLLVAFAPGNVDVPTTSVVLEHPVHGVVLRDTGINEAVADPDRGDDYWGPGLPPLLAATSTTTSVASDASGLLQRLARRLRLDC